MLILEIFILVVSIIIIGIAVHKKAIKSISTLFLLGMTLFTLILHIIFINATWQLLPLDLVILLLSILVYFKTIKKLIIKNSLRITTITVLSLLTFLSVALVYSFPTYPLPTPNGDYFIGTQSFVIEDETRYELYTDDPNDFRKIKIQIWYPAETTEGYEQSPWLEDGIVVARALSNDMGLPFFVLDQTADIMSHSYFDAPISNTEENYPVIVISHGWRGFRNVHTDYAEELASLGYIVIGIDHTYGSVATVFSNNDISYLNKDALPSRETTPDFIDYAHQLVYTYASDITTTLDYLEALNDSSNTSQFSEKLDLTKIGLLGHSTGGGADVAIAINDNRIDAVIGLDAWVESIDDTEIDKGLSMPSLFLRSGAWETGLNNSNLYAVIKNSSSPSNLYQIEGITHYDFAMDYMYSPLTSIIGISGDVEGRHLNTILTSIITNFFDKTLKNISNNDINPDTWDEVNIIEIP